MAKTSVDRYDKALQQVNRIQFYEMFGVSIAVYTYGVVYSKHSLSYVELYDSIPNNN